MIHEQSFEKTSGGVRSPASRPGEKPREDDPPPEEPRADEGAREGSAHDHVPVVLVADDEEEIADTYAAWLDESCDVETAYGGHEALEKLSDDVDAVLLDRRMPDVPGDEVLRQIREDGLDCRVSMLTAVEPTTDLADLAFDGFLTKPASKADVLAAADELLGGRSGERAPGPPSTGPSAERIGDGGTERVRGTQDLESPGGGLGSAETRTETGEDDDRLERLERLNGLVRSVNKAVVGADSSQELGRNVCRELVTDLPYEGAVFGEYVEDHGRFVPSAQSGEDLQLDPITCPPDGPLETALSRQEIALASSAELPEDGLGQIHRAVADGRPHDAVVVPVRHRGQVRGTVVLFADGGLEMDQREEATLLEVGDAIGNALTALQTRELVDTDSIVELELAVTDGADAFVALSGEHGCAVQVDGMHLQPDGDVTCFFTVSGASADDAIPFLERFDGIDDVRVVDDTGEDLLLQCSVSGASIVSRMMDTAAAVSEFHADDGVGTVVAAFPPSADLRAILDSVREGFEDVELVSKATTEGPYQSVGRFRGALEDALTERQDDVLRAAFRAGYFEWPRESTAEDVAEALGLAAPTLHEYLREAERKLVDVYLDETDPSKSLTDG